MLESHNYLTLVLLQLKVEGLLDHPAKNSNFQIQIRQVNWVLKAPMRLFGLAHLTHRLPQQGRKS